MKFPDHSDLTTVTIEDVGEFRVTMDRIGAVDPRDHWYEEYVDATAELAPLRAQYAAQLNLTIETKGEIDTLRADAAATIDQWADALTEIATLRAALDGHHRFLQVGAKECGICKRVARAALAAAKETP